MSIVILTGVRVTKRDQCGSPLVSTTSRSIQMCRYHHWISRSRVLILASLEAALLRAYVLSACIRFTD
jgi:hypothetical protein